RALGIFKPTRVLRMRSSTEGTISMAAFMAGLPDRPGADNSLVEVEWARGDDIAGAQDHDRFVATGIDDPPHFPMTCSDPALVAPARHGTAGNQTPFLDDANPMGESMHPTPPLRGPSGNAKKFPADPHHPSVPAPPF